MFTVKFYKHIENQDGGSDTLEQSISCVNYQAYTRSSGVISITTYQKMTDIDGVDRHVSNEESHFNSCYVENQAGKTIAAFNCRSL